MLRRGIRQHSPLTYISSTAMNLWFDNASLPLWSFALINETNHANNLAYLVNDATLNTSRHQHASVLQCFRQCVAKLNHLHDTSIQYVCNNNTLLCHAFKQTSLAVLEIEYFDFRPPEVIWRVVSTTSNNTGYSSVVSRRFEGMTTIINKHNAQAKTTNCPILAQCQANWRCE